MHGVHKYSMLHCNSLHTSLHSHVVVMLEDSGKYVTSVTSIPILPEKKPLRTGFIITRYIIIHIHYTYQYVTNVTSIVIDM